MYLEEITFFDVFLSLFYCIIILAVAFGIRVSYRKSKFYNFLLPFTLFKISCAILFVVIHIYFYRGGDTFLFFSGGKFIANYLIDNPSEIFQLFTFDQSDFQSFNYRLNYMIISSFSDPTTLFISQIISIFCLLAFNSFLTTTILFSTFSIVGIWLLYVSVCRYYPKLYKVFAICFLFIPTVGIWGSGILKDTVTFSAIGLIFYGTINLIERKNIITSLLLIGISIFFCLKLKPYILYTYIPAIFLWLQFIFSNRVKSTVYKLIFIPFLIFIFSSGASLFMTTVSAEAGKYSLANLESMAEGFHSWHTYLAENRDQSGYTLGEFEFTPTGIISQFPEAIFVTFYRPLPHEVRNIATLIGSLESTLLLLITLYILFKVGIIHFLKSIFLNPEIQFFLFFSLALGIAVGLTSYNFGALSRYKIPCMPFYTAALALIYYLKKNQTIRKGV